MEKEPNKKDPTSHKATRGEERKIDGNAIVSPKNTRKLYGKKPLDVDEPPAEPTSEAGIPVPDDTDENRFPSAP